MSRLFAFVVAAVIVAGALFGLDRRSAHAAPFGAATNLTAYAQGCLPDGTVQVRFAWTPGNFGTQWFDITTLNNNFASGWLNAGPLAFNHNNLDWNWLVPNTRYYVRVNTLVNGQWAPSDTITFVTASCGGFTPPTGLTSTILSSSSVRWDWNRGNGNSWFCVDAAYSAADLLTFSGTFRNWGCGATGTQLTGTGLACGTKHYWRVFAWGPVGSGHSPVREFTTAACNFSPPDDLTATVLGPSSVRFNWDRGPDNRFICIDTAQSEADLTGIKGTFMNHGCGVPSETFTSNVVPCGVKSYWRIWALGTNTSGYSAIGSFTTPACPFTPPTKLDADTIDHDSIHFEWQKGVDNLWSCVDTAKSEADLNSLSGTWQNHGCGTTADELIVNGLVCNTTYYWRVFSRGSGGSSGSSVVATSKTAACP